MKKTILIFALSLILAASTAFGDPYLSRSLSDKSYENILSDLVVPQLKVPTKVFSTFWAEPCAYPAPVVSAAAPSPVVYAAPVQGSVLAPHPAPYTADPAPVVAEPGPAIAAPGVTILKADPVPYSMAETPKGLLEAPLSIAAWPVGG